MSLSPKQIRVYLLKMGKKKDSLQVAYHISVPNEKNEVDYSYQQAIRESLSPESVVPHAPEKAKSFVSKGTYMEIVTNIKFPVGSSYAYIMDKIKDITEKQVLKEYYSTLESLKFWGRNYEIGSLSPLIVTVSDSFDRSNSSNLGSNWEEIYGDVIIESQTAVGNVTEGENIVKWVGNTFNSNQWSECTVYDANNQKADCGTAVRIIDKYNMYWFSVENNRSKLLIRKKVNNVQTILTSISKPVNEGDTLRLEAEGNMLSGYLNGDKLLVVTDLDLTSGTIGFRGWKNRFKIDNWSGGNL